MRILAVTNQKGGVGKTTTTINLGAALAAVGERVLILDLDPQGNASTGLGVPPHERKATTYDILVNDAPIEEAVINTLVPGLDIAPSDADLAAAELDLSQTARRNFRLRDALERFHDGRVHAGLAPYDYVLMDCPPSLNVLTINALTAADGVLVPLQCEFFALEGLVQLQRTIDRVKENLNPRLEIQGVVLTMYDSRNNLARQVAEDVRAHFGNTVYQTAIPRNVRVSEAPSFGRPALIYDYRCAGSQAYMRFASELISRERQIREAA